MRRYLLSKIKSLVFFIFITSSCTAIKQQPNKDTWLILRSESDNMGVKAWCSASSYVAVAPNSWNLDSIVVYHNGAICKDWKNSGLRVEKSGLASVIITTKSGTMSKVDASIDKSVSESGVISIYDEEGNNIYKGPIDKIHGRGNRSWKHNKKPYNIKLKEKVSLFDFRKSRSYCFLGASDPSMLRNKITYLYAERLGMPYSIRTHHVSLWTNGEYRGVYLMTEKVSAGKSGANLHLDDSEDCGVIIEMPQSGDSPKMQFKTASGSTIALKDPKIVSKDNFERIKQRYLQMETSVIGDNSSICNDISQYLDVESFAKYYLLQEGFYNYDAYSGSYYMYKDADFVDSLFYCAPLWDMDNCCHATLREACSFYNRKHADFISSLCANPVFWNEVQSIYNNEFGPLLDSFTTEIDSLYSIIKYDMDLDNLLYHRSVSPSIDVENIKHFMTLRKDFLDNHISSNADTSYCSVVVKSTPQELWMHPSEYIVQVGDTFSLEGIKTQYEGFNYIGCFYSDGRPFNPQEPIYSDLFISMKWESTDFGKRWKARIDQWRVDFGAYRRALLK